MENLELLEKRLGYKFKNRQYLIEALTHKSYNKPYNNERLEFIGDSIVNFAITMYLYKYFPDSDEGSLSKLRSSLVSQAGLYKIAEYLSIGRYILISDAEDRNQGRYKKSLLADSVEAIIAAIYLDSGENISIVQNVITSIYNAVFPNISLDTIFKDFKTTLQEITQSRFGVIPEYRVLSTSGPDHNKTFEIGVYIENRLYAVSTGKSKKNAEQQAAEIAIQKLDNEN
ncbi:MAG TPA: ribonuclease III [Campylobacterales bacterium]|nr:ribonuclease III [Campylobacterales bacterium]HIO70944.1 ribonuclease III [Campylobacterales bacterium]